MERETLAERGQRSRQGRHDREDVVDAAIRILDRTGLPDVTMRRLAAELGVRPSALYWHFDNKQSLLAAVSDRIVLGRPPWAEQATDALIGVGEWAAVVRIEALLLRRSLLAHRDGAEIVSSTEALGLGSGIPLARLRSAIGHGGFGDPVAGGAAVALLHFVLGSVMHEQQRSQAQQLGVGIAPEPRIEHAFEQPSRELGGEAGAADLAHARALVASAPGVFAFGVDLIVSGLGSLRSAT